MREKQVTRFTATEAREKVGHRVRSLIEFAGVPKGTEGVVIDVHEFGVDKFDVVVEWDLPRRENLRDRFAKEPYGEFLWDDAHELAYA